MDYGDWIDKIEEIDNKTMKKMDEILGLGNTLQPQIDELQEKFNKGEITKEEMEELLRLNWMMGKVWGMNTIQSFIRDLLEETR